MASTTPSISLPAVDKVPGDLRTRILPISIEDIGTFGYTEPQSFLHPWTFTPSSTASGRNLVAAARHLQMASSPVAFPTETVYGLAADATSSTAVRGIYKAKQRPTDNPLIVHVSSLDQLRSLLGSPTSPAADPIPSIYQPLIQRFWPGPLTIILPLPDPSSLAPEVTAGLRTFGARMPSSLLALALIQTSGLPLAAPSANASTRPSPTTAAHVAHDLDGRIELILDGGPCSVGVESTVVDGLSDPPCVLRPGGVGIEQLRACGGVWSRVVKAYEDREGGGVGKDERPRAPGMKYRHYSPRAKVVLVDPGLEDRLPSLMEDALREGSRKIGVLRTSKWSALERKIENKNTGAADGGPVTMLDRFIGPSSDDVARGLFSALRDMDLQDADVIFVEGIEDNSGEHAAAAVMNRLRKAAGSRIQC